jgi:peptidoglycan/xylan/chitin deacetylase (PgdA/CDA1 family)
MRRERGTLSKNMLGYLAGILLVILLLSGCAGVPAPSQPASAPPGDGGDSILARSDNFLVLVPASSSTYATLAATYYGDARLSYLISDYNQDRVLDGLQEIVIPLKPVNPGGLYADGYQTVPILCYHHFDHEKAGEMNVSAAAFEAQMAYLKENKYQTITLADLQAFVAYQRRPPKNAVLITVDDGWKSLKTVAAPILKKHGFRATLFVYTDLIRSKSGGTSLTWDEIRELVNDGVIDIQPHTATHADLTKVTDAQLDRELIESRRVIEEKLGIKSVYLAYPYGTFNDRVIEALKRNGYQLGLTVVRGANAFFYNPYSLNRSMIYNKTKLEDFARQLETFRRN